MPLIQQFIDSQVAVITLADSERGNRLNTALLEKLSLAMEKSMKDPEVRVIVLRSNGKIFCRGMDLNLLQEEAESSERLRRAITLYSDLLFSILTSSKPVMVLVAGDVQAGGVGIVSACDIVICSSEATFELSEVLFGIIPANVLPFLLSIRIPLQKARYLVLTAKKITAEEACRIGLADEVFSTENFERGVKQIIKALLRSSPHALAETKDFTLRILNKGVGEARRLAIEKLLNLIKKREIIEAISAFNRGELPPWFGKYRPMRPLTGV
ncbi:MAG: hypothetical protein DRP87_01780 [Spirochaetes bacterium]|nr:MAG: hypothetical protein DRP87_01780 [Spirochaetota bacterium]